MIASKRVAVYLRVSTQDQTTENQLIQLQSVAAHRGWTVVQVYRDEGISGSKGRDRRPGLDQMLKEAGKGKFDIVMSWAIDRLGRSLIDLLGTVQYLEAVNVDLYLDQQNIDTTTPAGKLMFQITGAFAEFERSMIRTRTVAGIARAKAQGKTLGRPTISQSKEREIRAALAKGDRGMLKIAAELGVGSGTVQKVAQAMKADAASI